MAKTNKMIGHFEGKPNTERWYQSIEDFVMSLPHVKKTVKAQVSYAVKRKFLWLWSYENTPDGTLYAAVMLDEKWENENVHAVTQVSKNRWNHSVVIKSMQTAESDWFQELIQKGYQFAEK